MAEVNRKGVRKVTSIGSWHTYDYKSPGVNFPNEKKQGDDLAELSGGVTTTYLSKTGTERYLQNRRIGRLSKVKK